MATAVTIRNLYARLGFSVGSATTITNDQGIDSLYELKLLHDNNCEILWNSIHRSGDTIIGQGGVDIPNPGIPVSLWANMNPALTTCYLRHLDKISRIIGTTRINLSVVRLSINLKEHQESHEQPATAPKSN